MARTRILRAQRAAKFAAAAAVAMFVASPASAFYFRGWPGDGIPRDRNLVSPKDRFTDIVPGRTTPREFDLQDDTPTTGQPPGASATPEPGSVVLAAIGIGVVGVLRRKLKRRV